MITDADIQKLATVFATKEDFQKQYIKIDYLITKLAQIDIRLDSFENIFATKKDLEENTDYIVREFISLFEQGNIQVSRLDGIETKTKNIENKLKMVRESLS